MIDEELTALRRELYKLTQQYMKLSTSLQRIGTEGYKTSKIMERIDARIHEVTQRIIQLV